MSMVKRNIYRSGMMVLFAVLPLFVLSQKPKNGLTLQFNHCVGDKPMVLDDSLYVNALNQSFTVTKFNYYIGMIRLKQANGKEFLVDTYYFISEDEEKQATKTVFLDKIPAGEYTSVSFIIGVDSAHNCSGAQSGALDPINAMFWTWNTGYIFMKLEGKTSSSSLPGNTFEYHIGGYKEPSNSIRTVELNFDTPLIIAPKENQTIQIKADASELLKTPTTIDFTVLPAVNTTLNATMIADNYVDIFKILEITYEK